MSEIQVYVHSTHQAQLFDLFVDKYAKLLDFRKMVANIVNIPYQDLVLVGNKEFNYEYNSKTLNEIGIGDQSVLFAVLKVGGGKHI